MPDPDYDALLDRAGVTGLTEVERALLAPVLPMIDAKIALLRQREAFSDDPTDPVR